MGCIESLHISGLLRRRLLVDLSSVEQNESELPYKRKFVCASSGDILRNAWEVKAHAIPSLSQAD